MEQLGLEIGKSAWILDRGRWYVGVVEGAMGGTRFDKATRYMVRWGDGGCFGIKRGIRKLDELRPIDDSDPIASQLLW